MSSFNNYWTQYFPDKPSFTEVNLPSQVGKVFIVTGGNNGVGFELVKMLYGRESLGPSYDDPCSLQSQ